MKYIIDGYNLAHRLTLPAGTVSPTRLAQARTQLLAHLSQRHGPSAREVTVVFDCLRKRNVVPEEVINGIDVRFALGESADDLIGRLIQEHSSPKHLSVVSDDRAVQAAGRRRGCRVLACDAYLDELDRRGAGLPASGQNASQAEKPVAVDSRADQEWLKVFSSPASPRPKRRI